MNEYKSKFKAVFFFVLTFAFGYSLFYGYIEERFIGRDPAAVSQKIYQIKNFDPNQLKDELSSKIQVQSLENGQKFLRFKNLSSHVCKQYKEVQIQFFADGVSVAGQPPEMTVVADCLPAQDPAEMASIEIPIEKIIKQKPGNFELNFDSLHSRFIFKGAADEWPKTWILKAVIFKSEKGSDKVVTFDTKISSHQEPVVLEF